MTISRCRCHEAPEAWRYCPLSDHDHSKWTRHGWNCPASCNHPDAVAAHIATNSVATNHVVSRSRLALFYAAVVVAPLVAVNGWYGVAAAGYVLGLAVFCVAGVAVTSRVQRWVDQRDARLVRQSSAETITVGGGWR